MPVEIRELQITTVVQDIPSSKPTGTVVSSSSSGNDAIITACVEQVLEILKRKNER